MLEIDQSGFLANETEQAFSQKTKKEIYKRDGGASKWSGVTNHLEVSHISHDKDKSNYDDPSNGRLLSITEHLLDHINRHGRNGLTPAQNRWSIEAIKRRMYEKFHKIGDPE